MSEQSNHRDKEKDLPQGSKRSEENPSKKEEGTPIYLTSDSTLQSPSEHAHDKSIDPNKNTRMEASNDDLHDINAGKLTGRDGTDTDQP
jgi:hypothetical protein